MGQPVIFAGFKASLKSRCLETETYYCFCFVRFSAQLDRCTGSLKFLCNKSLNADEIAHRSLWP